ncbi:MAG: hypothetical protein ACLQBX_13780 [Candidatus Limnocylindrales bacterium]
MKHTSATDKLVHMTIQHHISREALNATVDEIVGEIVRDKQRLSMAFHEAGHAVAAVALGAVLDSAVVTDGKRTGNTFGRPSGLTTLDSEIPAGRTASIAYAGPWSQARASAGKRPTMAQLYAALQYGSHEGKDGDGAKLCMTAGGTASGSVVTPLIERCWSAVTKVADKLFRDGCADHSDVCAALGLSSDPEIQSVELALIRSGSTPGTFKVSQGR